MGKITQFNCNSYMRKIALLTMLFALFTATKVEAQCTDMAFMYPTMPVASNNSGIIQNIIDCNYTLGDYSTLTGLTVGADYEFSIRTGSTYGAGTHKYITVTDDDVNIIAHGPSPLMVTGITASTVLIHYSDNASCDGVEDCHNSQFRLVDTTTAAPGCASGPTPADNAVDVATGTVEFSWTAPTTGDPAVSYNMYYGLTEDNVTTLVGNFTETEVDINLTGFNTEFFWQIVPVNSGGSPTGCPIWSFTTEEAPGYCLTATSGLYPTTPTTPATCDGITPNEITANGWAGEYSVINVIAGETYTFYSSVATDFFTIADALGTIPLEYGTTPVTWVSDVTGPIRLYHHADDECADENVARTRYVICGMPSDEQPDYVSLQWPPTMTLEAGATGTVYGQVYEGGLTDVAPLSDQAEGIQAWVGISPEGQNTNPETWTTWIESEINPEHVSNNDEYMTEIGAGLAPGTYYYATRFRLNTGTYVYGGINASNAGNFWDGTEFNSGVLTINPIENDFCEDAIPMAVGTDFASGAIATTNSGASANDEDPIPGCDFFGFEDNGNDIWFSVVVPASGNLTIETRGNGDEDMNDTGVEVYSGTCGALVSEGCNGDISFTNYYSLFSVEDLTPGETVLVRVWGYNGLSGNFDISAYDATEPCDIDAPTGDDEQILEAGQTLADLDVEGDNLTWYSDEELETEIPDTTVAEDGTTYYVTQADGDCTSEALDITVTIEEEPCDIDAPEGDDEQTLEPGQTLADLDVEGNDLTWYSDETLETEIPDTTVAEDGTTYYVTQTEGDCTSEALDIDVTIVDPCAGLTAPEGNNEQDFTIGETLADLDVTGEDLTWYADEAMETELPETTPLVDGAVYYVTQSTATCESEALEISVNLVLGAHDFDSASLTFYPNPVTDVLNLSYSKEITSVTILNMLGQEVYTKAVNTSNAQIDVSHLAGGNYLVKVVAGDTAKTIKIVKR